MKRQILFLMACFMFTVSFAQEQERNLKLLVDYCEKTVATVDGGGYSEIVLYQNENDGSYSLHTYVKNRDSGKEVHRVFPASEEIRKAVFDLIQRLELAKYEGKRGFDLEGKEYVVRFWDDEKTVRVSTHNFKMDGRSKLSQVGKLLYDAIR